MEILLKLQMILGFKGITGILYIEALLKKESPVSSLNENESTVYSIIKANGDCKIGFILDQVEMTRAGLKTLLKRMVDAGYIKSIGLGKGTNYYV